MSVFIFKYYGYNQSERLDGWMLIVGQTNAFQDK